MQTELHSADNLGAYVTRLIESPFTPALTDGPFSFGAALRGRIPCVAIDADEEAIAHSLHHELKISRRLVTAAVWNATHLRHMTSAEVGIAAMLRPLIMHLDRQSGALDMLLRDVEASSAAAVHDVRLRSAMLDPETFAEELHVNEYDLGQWRPRIHRLLDGMAEAFRAERRRQSGAAEVWPLFLVMITDAHRSLERCLEIIDAVSHPRVLILLTGNAEALACSGRVTVFR